MNIEWKSGRVEEWRGVFLPFVHSSVLPLCIFTAWGLSVEGGHAQAANTSSAKVNVSTSLSVKTIHPGSQFHASVVLDVTDGWHINAHTPSFDYLIGTALDLTPPEGVTIVEVRYPSVKKLTFAFAEDALDVYEGRSPITLTIKVSKERPPGRHIIPGKLRVQACNDQVCLAPSTVDVEIPFEVVGSDQPVESTSTTEKPASQVSGTTGGGSATSGTPEAEHEIARLFEHRGAFLAFLGIFVIGLALNLTPCVYPMLSVTVSLFGGQTDRQTLRVFFRALVYVLGMATMYSVLGVVAALTGGVFGGVLQSPWVLTTIAVLMFGLAVSMFGLYELQMPYWLTSRLGGTTATGIIGIYLSGLVVGVFAAPCIGPPILALLAFVGTKSDPILGFWTFFTLSCGLGFPYLVLGTFSGLLKKMPTSGVWMVWVKKVFGVVLAGVACFYLGLALLPRLIVYVVPLTLFIGGIYLGFLERSGKQNRTLQKIQWGVGIAAVLFALITLNALRKPGMDWELYSPQKLQEARSVSRPVMLDFYADWCIPCLELDRLTFTHPEVIKATEDVVRLKVDLTHYDSPEAETLRQQFDIVGVPTIIFLGSDGREVQGTRIIGYLPPEQFIERIQSLRRSTTMETTSSVDVAPRVGDRAPDFTLPDLLTGQPVALHDFQGKKTIVFVWASW
jgi:thiol:disulfide interchange protein DsbD